MCFPVLHLSHRIVTLPHAPPQDNDIADYLSLDSTDLLIEEEKDLLPARLLRDSEVCPDMVVAARLKI